MSDPDTLRRSLTQTVRDSYLPLIERMRFYIEPEISCSRFFAKACFTEESLAAYRGSGTVSVLAFTEMGGWIAQRLEGGLFLDIPCGLASARDAALDFDMLPLLARLRARECWEVDLMAECIQDRLSETIDVLEGGTYRLARGIGEIGNRTAHGLEISTMQDDVLGFLAKMPDAPAHSPKAIYISALQPDAALCKDAEYVRTVAAPYLKALYDECARVCDIGDLVILNSSAMLSSGIDEAFPLLHPALALPPRGFRLARRCAYDKVHAFSRE
jgi:hypothetical protein